LAEILIKDSVNEGFVYMNESKGNSGKKGSGNMDEIAKTIFAPVYPVIADNIIRRFGITEGICIDPGSGPASLSIAVAEKTDLDVIAFDYSEDMQEAASKNIREAGLEGRITLICGDVHAMPFDDDYADLIISRGSMFFWD
jgi:ubiquinone/menaquinone biosynthesis C-methylase UbiE